MPANNKTRNMVKHWSSLSLFIYLNLIFVPIFAELQRFHHPVKGDGSLSFLVVGDWGRYGLYNQSHVAFQMGVIGEKLDIDFVVSTGDNFYEDGLNDVNDPAFLQSFKYIYTAKSLQKPWYSDIVEFFFMDTTPFVDDYFLDPEEHTYDWRGISRRGAYLNELLEDVALTLKESTARWKIVVGHHPIRSIGHHGDTQELITQLLPLLEANNVDFYINGHDHCLEHAYCVNSKIRFLTSGGGSKAWMTDDIKKHKYCEFDFFDRGQGFMSMEVTSAEAKFVFYDVFGRVGYQSTVSKLDHSSM